MQLKLCGPTLAVMPKNETSSDSAIATSPESLSNVNKANRNIAHMKENDGKCILFWDAPWYPSWKHGEWQHHPVRKTKRRVNDAQRL